MKSRFLKIAAFGFVFAFFLTGRAFALTVLKGQEAKDFIGDPKAHFVNGQYSFNHLNRNHRDPMHGRFSDGVIFNPAGGKMFFYTRKDGECSVVLNAPNGRDVEPVNEDLWRTKIKNALSDDNRDPVVFLDDNKKELGVVYVGEDTKVEGKMTDDKLLRIEIVVRGAQGGQTMRRR